MVHTVRSQNGARNASLQPLRHTHATLLIRANVHPKVVSD